MPKHNSLREALRAAIEEKRADPASSRLESAKILAEKNLQEAKARLDLIDQHRQKVEAAVSANPTLNKGIVEMALGSTTGREKELAEIAELEAILAEAAAAEQTSADDD